MNKNETTLAQREETLAQIKEVYPDAVLLNNPDEYFQQFTIELPRPGGYKVLFRNSGQYNEKCMLKGYIDITLPYVADYRSEQEARGNMKVVVGSPRNPGGTVTKSLLEPNRFGVGKATEAKVIAWVEYIDTLAFEMRKLSREREDNVKARAKRIPKEYREKFLSGESCREYDSGKSTFEWMAYLDVRNGHIDERVMLYQRTVPARTKHQYKLFRNLCKAYAKSPEIK